MQNFFESYYEKCNFFLLSSSELCGYCQRMCSLQTNKRQSPSALLKLLYVHSSSHEIEEFTSNKSTSFYSLKTILYNNLSSRSTKSKVLKVKTKERWLLCMLKQSSRKCYDVYSLSNNDYLDRNDFFYYNTM